MALAQQYILKISEVDVDLQLDDRLQTALEQISDWYLPEDGYMNGSFYPKSQNIKDFPFLFEVAQNLLQQCTEKTKGDYDEFVVSIASPGDKGSAPYRRSYRGHRIETIQGAVYALRRMPQSVPSLSDLGLDPALRKILLSEQLNRGGLVLICGETGQGKSTTCAATIKERMFNLGSFCLTVEDPPEMPLHGIHGDGRCYQTEVKSGNFAQAMKGAMRCFPTVNGSMLYVGETRDHETAAEVLRIAMNGNLVFTTIHASDVPNSLKRLLSLASQTMGPDAKDILSSVFRVGMHQVLEEMRPLPGQPLRKKLYNTFLLSNGSSSPVANKIRREEIDSLPTDIQQQRTVMTQQGPDALMKLWQV